MQPGTGLEIVNVDFPLFRRFLARHGYSPETGSRISSQYEAQLAAQDPSVGVFGAMACGELVGALSWGDHSLPREPGCFARRLDVVVCSDSVRGSGLGRLLMCEFVCQAHDAHAERLRHLSTIAVHPAVVRVVESLGFRAAENMDTPLFQASLAGDEGAELLARARRGRVERLRTLRTACSTCLRGRGGLAWCKVA